MRATFNMQKPAIAFGLVLLVTALIIGLWSKGVLQSDGNAERGGPGGVSGKHTGMADFPPTKSSDRTSPPRDDRISHSLSSSLDGWTVNTPGKPEDTPTPPWRLVDGKLVSEGDGGIAREVDMPPFAKLSLNLKWHDQLRFRLLLFSDNGQTTQPENTVELIIQGRFVYLRKRWMEERRGGSAAIGRPTASIPTGVQNARLDLYIARDAKTFALYVDGKQCGLWQDPKPEDGAMGDWLQFLSEKEHVISLSNLIVTDWDGVLPEGHDMKVD